MSDKALEPTFCGRTYSDIKRMEAENRRYRFALHTLLFGSFGKRPPRGAAMASLILRALMRDA